MKDPFAGPRSNAPPRPDITDSLIEENLDYVKALAREIHHRIGGSVEYDELVALGNQGLVEAARAFDPLQGAAFKTYAYYRIRGTIFDGMRRMSWSRTSRAALRHEELRDSTTKDIAGIADSDADIGRLEDEFAHGIRRLAVIHVVADLHDRDDVPIDSTSGGERVEMEELRAKLAHAITRLEPDERQLITSLYLDCKSMTDYARELGVHKSNVTRRHAKVIDTLHKLLASEDPGAG